MSNCKTIAFDYGASGGRAILGKFDGKKLELSEIHRFSNDPVNINGTFYWDVLRLFHEMKQGLIKCVKNGDNDISGIGTDTWGVDYGLIGRNGELLSNPVHYRDSRTEGMIEAACEVFPREEIYDRTGIAFQKFNTLYQIMAELRSQTSYIFNNADRLLFMPDLLNYFLTGAMNTEFTIASTSQMLKKGAAEWDYELLQKLGIPSHILGEIFQSGGIAGRVSSMHAAELGVSNIPVFAVAEHDTGSAVVSVPATEKGNYCYLSSGTWSLLGIETSTPVVNDLTYRLNYTNEGGFGRTTRLLKNIMGLWIYQECKREWDRKGETVSFDDLESAAAASESFISLINPDHDLFYSPGNMPGKIMDYCKKTGQTVPESKAAIVRCIMESLALKYHQAIEGLEMITGKKINIIHVVGGGCKNKMLCRFTANASGRPVEAGPVEATATGNIFCQLSALGEVNGREQIREIILNSFPIEVYEPVKSDAWEEAYGRFLATQYFM